MTGKNWIKYRKNDLKNPGKAGEKKKTNDKTPALKNVHRHYNDNSFFNPHGRNLSLSSGDCSRNLGSWVCQNRPSDF